MVLNGLLNGWNEICSWIWTEPAIVLTALRFTQSGAGWSLKLTLGGFLDATDEISTKGAIEDDLGVGRTEPEMDDDVGLTVPSRKPRKARLLAD